MTPSESLAGGFRRLHADLVARLRGWDAPDAGQAEIRDAFLGHLARHPDAMAKAGPPAHFTAGTLVVNRSLDAVLLTHHRRAGLWLQFGGHFESSDLDVVATATREAEEESGIPLLVEPDLIDLNRHTLLGDFGRCTEHLDVRFVTIVPDAATPTVSDESHDVRWWPIGALPTDAGDDLATLIERAVALVRTRV